MTTGEIKSRFEQALKTALQTHDIWYGAYASGTGINVLIGANGANNLREDMNYVELMITRRT